MSHDTLNGALVGSGLTIGFGILLWLMKREVSDEPKGIHWYDFQKQTRKPRVVRMTEEKEAEIEAKRELERAERGLP